MRYVKQSVCSLEKCYALSTLVVQGKQHLLVAGEKHAPCYLLDLEGNLIDTVWEEPGGVMTMVAIPDRDGMFLATHQFYSPNDSKQARLVCAKYVERGKWEITTIAELPFVHRFDIIEKNGTLYVLACTLKSDHAYKDDWRFPGKLLAGVLSDDPEQPLQLQVIQGGLTHNHGYTQYRENGETFGVISCDEGVYRVSPPEQPGDKWRIVRILEEKCSDAVLLDLDGDGKPELFTISPFHGNQIRIWHLDAAGTYRCIYEHPKQLPFLHAICSGTVYGTPCVFAGNREGERLLLCFRWTQEGYTYDVIDSGVGPANCLLFERDGSPVLLASNREIDEVALYEIFS